MLQRSFRARHRAFQAMQGSPPDVEFINALEFLENRDMDLSIRIGGMLAFNALMITIGTHPISASPGAPLSLDAPTQPMLTILSLVGIAPLVWSSILCLRALLQGEDFDADGFDCTEDDSAAKLRLRLFSAFIHSIDVQSRLLRQSVIATLIGGATTLAAWGAILWDKMA